jgi:hypothetical protein
LLSVTSVVTVRSQAEINAITARIHVNIIASLLLRITYLQDL